MAVAEPQKPPHQGRKEQGDLIGTVGAVFSIDGNGGAQQADEQGNGEERLKQARDVFSAAVTAPPMGFGLQLRGC